MLTAIGPRDSAVEGRDAAHGVNYYCPVCQGPVNMKRGPKRVAQFAHLPGADCPLAFETFEHMTAKQILVDRFRDLGLGAQTEVPLRSERRVDVAVALESRELVAIEVQSTAIAVDEMKQRIRDHRRYGCAATGWVFTRGRCRTVCAKATGDEVRLLDDAAYLLNRYRNGLYVLDVHAERLTWFRFQRVYRDPEIYYIPEGGGEEGVSSGRWLKRTFRLQVSRRIGFAPALAWTAHSKPGLPPERNVIFRDPPISPADLPELD